MRQDTLYDMITSDKTGYIMKMRQDSIHDMITNDKTHLTRSSSAQGQLVSWVETGLSGRVTYLSWVL